MYFGQHGQGQQTIVLECHQESYIVVYCYMYLNYIYIVYDSNINIYLSFFGLICIQTVANILCNMASQTKVRSVRKQYPPEKMQAALAAVRNGMSKKRASIVFQVPRTTLLDKLAGRVPEKARSGPSPVLTMSEERVLVEYLILMSKIGYPMTRKDLVNEVKVVLDADGRKNPFVDNRPGM